MILVALLPSLLAIAIFVGTFRLRRGIKARPALVVLPPAPPIATSRASVPDVAAVRRAVAATRIADHRAA